jgi:hypothetical protein
VLVEQLDSPRPQPVEAGCVERYTATAADRFARMLREWRASGADSHTISNAGPQAK